MPDLVADRLQPRYDGFELARDAGAQEQGQAPRRSLGPKTFSSHSLRRTKAAELYKRTGNLEAVRQLLGHSYIGMTQRYLGVEEEYPLRLAEQHEV